MQQNVLITVAKLIASPDPHKVGGFASLSPLARRNTQLASAEADLDAVVA